LIDPLERHHKRALDNLLNMAPGKNITWLMWLRQSPLKPHSRSMREHIERLKVFQSLALPAGVGRQIHQNRLLKMAREGAQMTPRDLAKFEDERRYATLAAVAIEGIATVTDELVDLHDRIMIKLFVGVGDSTYVLNGLLHHESDLRIEEHYTDTAGFTDHVFALMHLLGFRFAPRIRDLGDTKLYVPGKVADHPALRSMIGGSSNIKHLRAHWDDVLRLAASIKHGTVTASLMLRKLGSYPRQNGLAIALRELGRIERSLFILDWLQNVELRRRVHAGLNKGEARNALARAVFIPRLCEIRDRTFEQQRYRASGLNLVTGAIVLWNTVSLERAAQALRESGKLADDGMLQFLSPLGWEHINLTGDYVWRQNKKIDEGKYRPLRDRKDRA
jgi:hypothetical protein